jgi:restriction endonuclease S subunit
MQLLLDEIADVRMGLTLRGTDAAKRTVEEGPHYLRISDLSEGGILVISETQPIDPALDPDHRHRVKAGDIVLANRGTRMTAALVPENLNAVASSQLFVVRLKSPKILPTFLLAFLNLNSTQEHLRSHARGTYVQTLSIAILRSLQVPLLPFETQQKIASLSELADEERRLIAELSQKRAQFLNQSISRLLSNPS